MAKKKVTRKKKKEVPDETLKINGSFLDVIKVAVNVDKKKSKE